MTPLVDSRERPLLRAAATAAPRRLLHAVALSTALALALLAALAIGVTFGAVSIPLRTLLTAAVTPVEDWGISETILMQVRLPRVLTAAVVGAGLAISGVAMQTALRNPLAEPYLLGVSSGASFGAVSVLLLGFTVALPVAAFGGGLLALIATLALGRGRGETHPTRAILAGVAVTAVFSSLTSLVIFRSSDNDSYRQVLHWLLGSLSSVTWSSASVAAGTLLLLGGTLITISRLLDVLLLDDAEIHSLGIPVARARMWVLGIASLLAAGMVSVSGSIGFVGLIVPHIVGRLAALSQRGMIICSALAGALLLVAADTFSRLVVAPQELPVGITTALFGACVFATIMLRRREVQG